MDVYLIYAHHADLPMSQAVLVLYRTLLALLGGVPLLVSSLVLLEVCISPATALGVIG
jgi:hypothetical protein